MSRWHIYWVAILAFIQGCQAHRDQEQVPIGVQAPVLSAENAQNSKPDRLSLPPSARKVADAYKWSDYDLYYYWLTDRDVLFYEKSSNSLDAEDPYRLNLATREKTTLDKLGYILAGHSYGYDFLHVSPNGKWVLYARPEIHAATIETQPRQYQWERLGLSSHVFCMGDSRHWVQLVSVLNHLTDTGMVTQARIGQFGLSQTVKTLQLPKSHPLRTGLVNLDGDDVVRANLQIQDEDNVLGFARKHKRGSYEPVSDLREIIVYKFGLRHSSPPTRRFVINVPPGGVAQEMVFSPEGKRVAWLFPLPAKGTKEIWVSRLDGQNMRRILSVRAPHVPPRSKMRVMGSIYEVENDRRIYRLRWTPNGKRLSFLYGEALYTISTD